MSYNQDSHHTALLVLREFVLEDQHGDMHFLRPQSRPLSPLSVHAYQLICIEGVYCSGPLDTIRRS